MNNSTAIILILFLCISVGFNFLLLERMTNEVQLPEDWLDMQQIQRANWMDEQSNDGGKFAWLPLLVIAIFGILIPVLVCPAYHDWRWN